MASRIATVTTRLCEMILASELTPGERLRAIPFAQRLGVARTPLRIALGAIPTTIRWAWDMKAPTTPCLAW
jgi:GntR family transcriptional regulator of vanillate catabolism